MNLLDQLVEAADAASPQHSIAIRAAALKLAEHARLHKELALKLGNDAPHPSLCDLVADAGRTQRWPIDGNLRGVDPEATIAIMHKYGHWRLVAAGWVSNANKEVLIGAGYTHWAKL